VNREEVILCSVRSLAQQTLDGSKGEAGWTNPSDAGTGARNERRSQRAAGIKLVEDLHSTAPALSIRQAGAVTGSGKGLIGSTGNLYSHMASTPRSDENKSEEEPAVPAGVLEGIEDIAEGQTADGDDLDEALDL
jgi:hypothetical protein